MQAGSCHQVEIGGRRVDYVLVASRTARKLRLRVGLNGVEVVRPTNRTELERYFFGVSTRKFVSKRPRLDREVTL